MASMIPKIKDAIAFMDEILHLYKYLVNMFLQEEK